MKYQAPPIHDRVILRPGEHKAVVGGVVLQTLLGSCVAACLYDERARVAGMNHFLLANKRYAKAIPINATDAGRYGINAMEMLINDMLKLGARRSQLKAKVFGAGNIITTVASDNFLCIGEVNSRFIREFLSTEGIQTVNEDLGGELGRVIHFHTDSFKVFRRFIPKSETIEIEKKERRYWSVEIDRREREEGAVVLFDR